MRQVGERAFKSAAFAASIIKRPRARRLIVEISTRLSIDKIDLEMPAWRFRRLAGKRDFSSGYLPLWIPRRFLFIFRSIISCSESSIESQKILSPSSS